MKATLTKGHSRGIGTHWKLKIVGDKSYRVFLTKAEAKTFAECNNIELEES